MASPAIIQWYREWTNKNREYDAEISEIHTEPKLNNQEEEKRQ